jgi:hypothetical protein
VTELHIEFIKPIRLEVSTLLTTHARILSNARRARTIADREQQRGNTDMSVQQTRRMALSIAAAQRWVSACRRESIHLYHHAIGVLCANCPTK